jgi:hypothetical protein
MPAVNGKEVWIRNSVDEQTSPRARTGGRLRAQHRHPTRATILPTSHPAARLHLARRTPSLASRVCVLRKFAGKVSRVAHNLHVGCA